MKNPGFNDVIANIKLTLRSLSRTYHKSRAPKLRDIERSRAVSKNFFLHIHSAKVHLYTLRPSFTLGLGLITFFLFVILVLTGVLLMFYYTPSVERAYQSIQDIVYVVAGGRFIRNMHRWAAHGMVLTVILHMARIMYTGAYRESRRINWLIGISLLLITLLFSFSGYLLPWDQLAFWAVTIAANIAASVNELTDIFGLTEYYDFGLLIKLILFGDAEIGQPALNRFYLLHVVFLPLLAVILIGLHFWRIRKSGGLYLPENADGLINPGSDHDGSHIKKNRRYLIWSWTTLLWVEIAVFITTLAAVLIFAYYIDAPLRSMANPAIPENPAKSPWYFLGVQELVSYSAFSGGILIPILVITGLILIPYIDREAREPGIWFSGKYGRKIALISSMYSLVITVILLILLGFSGLGSDWPVYIKLIINPGTAIALAYILLAGYILYKTGSTRLCAVSLFTSIFWGYWIITAVGIWLRGPNWEIIL
jgi:quinol-cytochrome oxidoreductase complex cytochrome b subunit